LLITPSAFEPDGIDVDWEYPGKSGASRNRVGSYDAANVLSKFYALSFLLLGVSMQWVVMANRARFGRILKGVLLDWILWVTTFRGHYQGLAQTLSTAHTGPPPSSQS